jgi:hypothetical protein
MTGEVGVKPRPFYFPLPAREFAQACALEQFQQKRAAVLRPELRRNKSIDRFRDSKKSGNALAGIREGEAP